MKTLKQKIKGILGYTDMVSGARNLEPDTRVDQILQAVKEAMPKKKDNDINKPGEAFYYNQAISDFLKKIEEGGETI